MNLSIQFLLTGFRVTGAVVKTKFMYFIKLTNVTNYLSVYRITMKEKTCNRCRGAGNMQRLPTSGKHASAASSGKPQSTTAIGAKRGKNTTGFMHGKTCNRCHDQAQEVQENLQPASSAGKRSNQCQGQKKACNWYQARARETCIRC